MFKDVHAPDRQRAFGLDVLRQMRRNSQLNFGPGQHYLRRSCGLLGSCGDVHRIDAVSVSRERAYVIQKVVRLLLWLVMHWLRYTDTPTRECDLRTDRGVMRIPSK